MKQIVLSKGKNRNKITSARNRKAGLISELRKTTSVVCEKSRYTRLPLDCEKVKKSKEISLRFLQSSPNLKLVLYIALWLCFHLSTQSNKIFLFCSKYCY